MAKSYLAERLTPIGRYPTGGCESKYADDARAERPNGRMTVDIRLLGVIELHVDCRVTGIGHARQKCVLIGKGSWYGYNTFAAASTVDRYTFIEPQQIPEPIGVSASGQSTVWGRLS
ncbi:hypothetical protein Rhe02_08740 [Rhizocola hellebori]|uniref:Uncharacterized protein n=1 Tax=Rhizocola hellebori TaxID=1392758 RepID=A0A8J3Q3I0_9ACTN|nr:hypothetical protein [Rhizocola hellebori]GIH02807.1 hypothetical protein Rhe02_08740 [Rhizocola hellebori]